MTESSEEEEKRTVCEAFGYKERKDPGDKAKRPEKRMWIMTPECAGNGARTWCHRHPQGQRTSVARSVDPVLTHCPSAVVWFSWFTLSGLSTFLYGVIEVCGGIAPQGL